MTDPSASQNLEALRARIAERKGVLQLAGLPVLWICNSSKRCQEVLENLETALGVDAKHAPCLHVFPRHDTRPYDRFSPQPFVISQRMATLYRWLTYSAGARKSEGSNERAPIVVTPASALLHPVPSRDRIREQTLHLEVGHHLDRELLCQRLLRHGYNRMPLVEEPGEFSARGDIIDIYPPHSPTPVRIELFGEEIESIRAFDAVTQRSLDSLGYAIAPPAKELTPSRDLIIERQGRVRELAEAQGVGESETSSLIDSLLRGHLPPGMEALAPVLLGSTESPLDFLPDNALIFLDEPAEVEQQLERYMEEAHSNFLVVNEAGRPACTPEELLVAPTTLLDSLRQRKAIHLQSLNLLDDDSSLEQITFKSQGHDELRSALQRARKSEFPLAPLLETLQRYREEGWRVTITASTLSGVERLHDLLEEYGLHLSRAVKPRPIRQWSAPGLIEIRKARLSSGFDLPSLGLAIFNEEEIFGPRQHRRTSKRLREGEIISGLAQLSKGDAVVHNLHGIGTYRGLITMQFGEATGDFLQLEYQGGDRFFLPVQLLSRVQRYVGGDGSGPRIDKLGGVT